jgi:amidase
MTTSTFARSGIRAGLALLLTTTATAARPHADHDAAKAAEAQIALIQTLDDAGPMLNAVIAYDPQAPKSANEAAEAGLPLEGRTVLVKDNIETREFPTTAGSLALKDNMTGRDAPMIANLRSAGGVVLGKTNLSEWANIRSDGSTSGWSAVGGIRQRGGDCGGLCVGGNRDGDQRFDHLPRQHQWHRRVQAQRRDRQPHPCGADFEHAGHRRADDAHGV